MKTNKERLREAMDLLARVSERWREDEVGLYPPTLPSFDVLVSLMRSIELRDPPWLPPVGARVRLTRAHEVMRDAVPAGRTGRVIESSTQIVRVRMDEHFEFLDEWNNELIWNPDNVPEQEEALRTGELEVGDYVWRRTEEAKQ